MFEYMQEILIENNNFLGAMNLKSDENNKSNFLQISMAIDEKFNLNISIMFSNEEIAKLMINLKINIIKNNYIK